MLTIIVSIFIFAAAAVVALTSAITFSSSIVPPPGALSSPLAPTNPGAAADGTTGVIGVGGTIQRRGVPSVGGASATVRVRSIWGEGGVGSVTIVGREVVMDANGRLGGVGVTVPVVVAVPELGPEPEPEPEAEGRDALDTLLVLLRERRGVSSCSWLSPSVVLVDE